MTFIGTEKKKRSTRYLVMSVWIWLILLVIIHTVDMSLTDQYVGNRWSHETFFLMAYTIKWCGIDNALWISRIITYAFIYCVLQYPVKLYNLLVVVTILYWTAMMPWVFFLGIVHWPTIPWVK